VTYGAIQMGAFGVKRSRVLTQRSSSARRAGSIRFEEDPVKIRHITLGFQVLAGNPIRYPSLS
jgi:hypothetical protein